MLKLVVCMLTTCVISLKIALFIITAVRTSYPEYK
jgi:hypothetical protein